MVGVSRILSFMERWRFKRDFGRFVSHKLTDDTNAWYSDAHPIMWAYAGGGRLHFYGNSKDAIDDSIRQGFNVIEVDVALTSDDVPVLTHWFRPNYEVQFDQRPTLQEFLSTPINGRFEPLSLKQLFENYGGYDGYFSIDPWFIYRDGSKFDLPAYIDSVTTPEQRRRIIYQAPNFVVAQKVKWKYASVHFSLPDDLDKTNGCWKLPYYVAAVTANDIHSVSLCDREITSLTVELVKSFRKSNVHVSIAGVDSVSRYWKWRDVGADIVNTRLLTPDMVKERPNG